MKLWEVLSILKMDKCKLRITFANTGETFTLNGETRELFIFLKDEIFEGEVTEIQPNGLSCTVNELKPSFIDWYKGGHHDRT